MALKKSIEKLDTYFGRLATNKVEKIEPSHVEKVLGKLKAKEASLLEELSEAQKATKKERLKSKLKVAREQIRRGEWLMQEISKSK